MKLNLQQFRQESTQMFVGTMTVKELILIAKVDLYTQENGLEKGYQRAPETSRALKLAKYLKTDPKPLLPAAILLSYRNTFAVVEEAQGVVTVELPQNETLWIIDGQHRIFGFKKAIEELGIERLQDYRLPVVIIENPTQADEANQFRIVNENMKKVRTDLARHILAMQISREGPGARKIIREQGRMWEAKSVEICRVLNADADSPWHRRIQMPNEKKSQHHVVRELSFSQSLKSLLNHVTYRTHSTQRIASLLINYWQAWKQTVPQAFEEPENHVLMKTPGVFICHMLVLHILEQLQSREITQPEVSDFTNILIDLEDYVTNEYWEKQNTNGAALAGSMKGFAMIYEEMVEKLPTAQ